MQHWHVVYTHARHENEAANDIGASLDFETFVPVERYKKLERNRPRIRVRERPLFPRYLFARFDIDQNDWTEIRRAKGVVDVLQNNDIPCRCPDGLIEQIKHAQQLGLFDLTKKPFPYPPGTIVRIDSKGPFADFVGKVIRYRPRERIELLVSFLSKVSTISVPLVRLSRA